MTDDQIFALITAADAALRAQDKRFEPWLGTEESAHVRDQRLREAAEKARGEYRLARMPFHHLFPDPSLPPVRDEHDPEIDLG